MVCAPQKIIYYLLCNNTLFLFYKLLSCCVGRKAVAMRETVVINIKYSSLITENCKIAKGWKTVTGGHFSGVTTKWIHAKNLLLTVESAKTFLNIKRVIKRAVFSTFYWIIFSCFFHRSFQANIHLHKDYPRSSVPSQRVRFHQTTAEPENQRVAVRHISAPSLQNRNWQQKKKTAKLN